MERFNFIKEKLGISSSNILKLKFVIMDTGLEEELYNKYNKSILLYKNYIDTSPWDSYGHGSAIFRILISIFPDAEFFIYRVCNDKGKGDIINLIQAMQSIVYFHNADIINLSLIFDNVKPKEKQILSKIMQCAKAQNIQIVSSLGYNENFISIYTNILFAYEDKESYPYLEKYPEVEYKVMVKTPFKDVYWQGKKMDVVSQSFATAFLSSLVGLLIYKKSLSPMDIMKVIEQHDYINKHFFVNR